MAGIPEELSLSIKPVIVQLKKSVQYVAWRAKDHMSIRPWRVLESNHLRDNIRVDTCELPNGKIIEPVILEFGNWVTIVALTKEQEVVLIKQYRHGVRKVILELPGGAMDEEDENPMQAARRELLEETGYSSDTFIEVGKVSPNPANQTNLIFSFLALDAERAGKQKLDDSEEIEVFLTPLEDVIEIAKNGGLLQSMQVSALFFALAHLNRIV